MRLGAPLFERIADPGDWIEALRVHGFTAAYCPLDHTADDATVAAYADAAARAGIVVAEVGAWSNPLAPDEEQAGQARALCEARLDLADRIGARCCVNISGSRGEPWDGHHPLNLTRDTFDRIVEITRGIIDAVKPTRSYFTLETMPWMYPDSVESYVDLVEAIDRERFAVHFDPVNLICSPHRYYGNGEIIRTFVERLGPRIRSCHAKDIALAQKLTTHLDEVRPGLGGLDYTTFLKELDKIDPDTPLMLEHLATEAEYAEAAEYIRTTAENAGLSFR